MNTMLGDDEFLNRVPRFLRREAHSDGAQPLAPLDVSSVEPLPEPPPVRPAHRVEARADVASPAAIGRPALVADHGRSVERPRAFPRPDRKSESDAPFQVTLPRDLIRQIRIRAAEEETTQRAIILRALKLYGFSIADGEDVDKRKASERRG